MIKHLPVTSLESGRLASAATALLSVARELDRAQNKRRKDRPRDRIRTATRLHADANLMITLSETEMQKTRALCRKPLDRVKLDRL